MIAARYSGDRSTCAFGCAVRKARRLRPDRLGPSAYPGEHVPIRTDAHICATHYITSLFIFWAASWVRTSSQNGTVDATPRTPIAPADSTNRIRELRKTRSEHCFHSYQVLPELHGEFNGTAGLSAAETSSTYRRAPRAALLALRTRTRSSPLKCRSRC